MTTRVVSRTTVLPVAPDAVWHAVMSPEIAPIIDPSVREWQPDREPVGVGTRFSIRGRLGVVPIRGTSEVVRWEPPTVATFESVTGSGPLQMTATHTCEAVDGGTSYSWQVTLTGPWPVVVLGAWLFSGALEKQSRALASYLARPPAP